MSVSSFRKSFGRGPLLLPLELRIHTVFAIAGFAAVFCMVTVSAAHSPCALRRREKSNSGPRPHSAALAAQAGSRGPANAQLQTQWHDDLVRCAEHAGWDGHWRLHAAASASRIHPLPATDPRQDTTGSGLASDRRQLRDAQASSRPILAERHPRFHLHFIPTSSSWLNMVERWFREITDKRIRRGSFQNVPDLIAAIHHYI